MGASPSREEKALDLVTRGDLVALRQLIARCGGDVNAVNPSSPDRSLLRAAVTHDQEAIVKFLLSSGVRVGAEGGMSCLVASLDKGDQVQQALIQAGATLGDSGIGPAWAAMSTLFHETSAAFRQEMEMVEEFRQDENRPLHITLLETFRSDRVHPTALTDLKILVFVGLTWDTACDMLTHRLEERHARAPAENLSRDSLTQLPVEVAKAIRACLHHWCAEQSKGLPLTAIPVEEVNKGLQVTQTYLDRLAESFNVVLRRKICVIGPSGWGKTSLVKSLITGKPSLELPENRTFGIDKFELSFIEELPTLKATWRHEVKFWDFAGHDEYQVSHALFFSRRTLYLVCVDLAAYASTSYKAEIMTGGDVAAFDERMNAFVETKILRWMRLILAREPAAEFKLACTKNDVMSAVDCDALVDLKARLQNVLVIVQDMRQVHRQVMRDVGRAVDGEPLPDRGGITHLGDRELQRMQVKPTVDMLLLDCTRDESVLAAQDTIQKLICKSQRSYPMPDIYSSVLRIIEKKRQAAKAANPRKRLADSFVKADALVKELVTSVEGMDEFTCRTILRALRDIGDVLWYEDFDDAFLRETVVLDPLLHIDLIRQIFNHKQKSAVMYHADLAELELWKVMEGDEALMLSMKRLLQRFHLAHPSNKDKVMKWDSDLMLPASWRSKLSAQLLFMGQPLKAPYGSEPLHWDVSVHWEITIASGFEEAQFDHLVVATYEPAFTPWNVGPDFIMYGDASEAYACRLIVDWHRTTHKRVLKLEAVLRKSGNPAKAKAEEAALWARFHQICLGLSSVFRTFPGLRASSSVRNGDHRPQLSTCLRPDPAWLPPEPTLGNCRRLLLNPGTVE